MTQDPNNTFRTPDGRIVGGSLSIKQTKKYDGTPQDPPQYVVIVAFPKTDPATSAMIEQVKRVGTAAFAHAPHALQNPAFAWKIADGDSAVPNQKGKVPNQRPGYAGHWVMTFSTQFEFGSCGADPSVQIDAATIKNGFWVRIAGDIRPNGSEANPGIFLNLKAAQFRRADDEIITGGGLSTVEAFGGAAVTPPVPAAMMPPVPGTPPPAGMTPPVPGTPLAPSVPAHDIVNNVAGPPPVPGAPSVPAPPVAPTGPMLTAKGVQEGCVPASWIAGGQWTEALLRTNGYIQ